MITIGSRQMDGSWFLAKNPVCTINDTEPSDWLSLKWFASIAKAWISLHLLAMARANRKAVLIVTWSLDALCSGMVLFVDKRPKINPFWGKRSLYWTLQFERANQFWQDWVRSDSITSLKFKSIWDHGSIDLDGTYLIFFSQKRGK